jgi:hypothetical protein
MIPDIQVATFPTAPNWSPRGTSPLFDPASTESPHANIPLIITKQ